MAKKKNYVTRDDNGIICLWQGLALCPVKIEGVWRKNIDEGCIAGGVNVRSISKAIHKAFIGNLPRKGTVKEFKRGEK